MIIRNSYEQTQYVWPLDDHFAKDLELIKETVKRHYQDIPFMSSAMYSSSYGITRHIVLENILYALIPNPLCMQFTLLERFIIIASAWLCDSRPISGASHDNIESSSCYRSYCLVGYLHDGSPILDISDDYLSIIGVILRYQDKSLSISACPELMSIRDDIVRVRLLAAYLRFADTLYIEEGMISHQELKSKRIQYIASNISIQLLRNIFLNGFMADTHTHTITLFFRYPLDEDIRSFREADLDIPTKIGAIYELLTYDLIKDTSNSRHILEENKIAYYNIFRYCTAHTRYGKTERKITQYILQSNMFKHEPYTTKQEAYMDITVNMKEWTYDNLSFFFGKLAALEKLIPIPKAKQIEVQAITRGSLLEKIYADVRQLLFKGMLLDLEAISIDIENKRLETMERKLRLEEHELRNEKLKSETELIKKEIELINMLKEFIPGIDIISYLNSEIGQNAMKIVKEINDRFRIEAVNIKLNGDNSIE